jgi:methyl-accepting chemotaxis protein
MFQTMSLSARLRLLAASALFMLLAALGAGLYQLHTLKTNLAASLVSAKTETDGIEAVETAQVAFKTQVQEWKNILIRGNDPKNFDKHLGGFGEDEKKVQASLKSAVELMRKQGIPPADTEALIKAHEELGVKYREALKSFDKSDPAAGKVVDGLVKGLDRATAEGMTKVVTQIETHAQQKAAEDIASAEVAYASARNAFIVFGVIGAALMLGISMSINRSLLGQIGGEPAYAMEIAHGIAAGDLTRSVTTAHGDTSSLLAAMGQMQAKLKETVMTIQAEAERVSSTAEQLSATSSQVAESSRQQSEAAASMAASVEEMTVTIDQVSERSAEATRVSSHSGELSKQGAGIIQGAAHEMERIAEFVEASSSIIGTLEQQSNEISTVVNVIKEIADQTNLLALNAAIEAARAGEQGRGFAVVADEVRKLAERTGQSTQEIARMIDQIQSGTRNAVSSMENCVIQVGKGVELATQAGSSIDEINAEAIRVVSVVGDISASLREQSAASNEIARNVETIAQMTEENSNAVRESASAAQHLGNMAVSLQSVAARFRAA